MLSTQCLLDSRKWKIKSQASFYRILFSNMLTLEIICIIYTPSFINANVLYRSYFFNIHLFLNSYLSISVSFLLSLSECQRLVKCPEVGWVLQFIKITSYILAPFLGFYPGIKDKLNIMCVCVCYYLDNECVHI